MATRLSDLIRVAIVLACWIGGAVLRFCPMPATLVGGGLLIVGTILCIYWARKRPPRDRGGRAVR